MRRGLLLCALWIGLGPASAHAEGDAWFAQGRRAVARRTDALAPPICVVKAGVSSTDLARHAVAGRALPKTTAKKVYDLVGPVLRDSEPRTLHRVSIDGRSILVLGVDPGRTHLRATTVRALGSG